MFRLFLGYSLLIGVLFSCTTETTTTDNRASTAVKEAFNAYKAAVLSQEGELAVSYLSSNSVEYYDMIIQHIVEGDKATIQGLSSGAMLQVLGFRHLFLKEELLSFDGKTLYQAMVERQLLEQEQLALTTIGKIAVKGTRAKGQMVLDGQSSPIFFDFRKEKTGWKIDVTTTVIMTSQSVEQQAKAANLSVPAYLEELMQLSPLEKETIWEPLKAS